MPERLRRLGNTFQRWPIYFVTACTSERRPLLTTESIHQAFTHYAQTGAEFGAWVGGYILMPDHLHMFVVIDDRTLSLSACIKSLKGKLSSVLRRNGQAAPYWQKGFFDHVLRSSDSYSAKWAYVRDNAVRAGLAERWQDWPFVGEVHPIQYRRE